MDALRDNPPQKHSSLILLILHKGPRKRFEDLSPRLWSTWRQDSIKAAVLRAMVPAQDRLDRWSFDDGIVEALVQHPMVRFLHSNSLEVEGVQY
jgi:hypothetical protein